MSRATPTSKADKIAILDQVRAGGSLRPKLEERIDVIISKYGEEDRVFTMSDVAAHKEPNDCLVVVHGLVYDVSDYLSLHPGGAELLFRDAGQDATRDFEGMFHSKNAQNILALFYVGRLDRVANSLSPFGLMAPSLSSNNKRAPTRALSSKPRRQLGRKAAPSSSSSLASSSSSSLSSSAAAGASTMSSSSNDTVLLANRSLRFFLDSKRRDTHDTCYFRFRLPPGKRLALKPGQHVWIMRSTADTNEKRPYTPVVDENGTFELLVKRYETGLVSSYLHSLSPGSRVPFRGPFGECHYVANQWKAVGMLAGGTGIAPMLQILRVALTNPNDKTQFSLLYANHSRDDILARDILSPWLEAHPKRLRIGFVVSDRERELPDNERLALPPTFDLIEGHINYPLLRKYMPPLLPGRAQMVLCVALLGSTKQCRNFCETICSSPTSVCTCSKASDSESRM